MTSRWDPRRALDFMVIVLLVGALAPGQAVAQAEDGAETNDAAEASKDDAIGEAGDPEESRAWFDEIVVAASRGESSVGEVPIHATVIPQAEILAAPNAGVIELLRHDPSISFRSDAGHLAAQPRDQSITMRGLAPASQSRALAMMDGLPMIDPYGGFVIWSQVPKQFIDRIEVVRGGGSSAWGNLALSGVVNLVTSAPSDRRFGTTVRGGSKSTVDLSAYYSDAGDAWAGWIGGNYFDTDGYIDRAEEARTRLDEPSNRQYESLTGKASYTFSPSAVLHVNGLVWDEDREEGTPLDRGTTEERWLAGTLDLVGEHGSSWQVRLFGRNTDTWDFNGSTPDPVEPQAPLSNIYDLPTKNFGLGGLWSSAGGTKHSLTAGADLQESAIERRENRSWDGTQFTVNYLVEGKQRLAGLFFEDSLTPTDRLSIRLAARYDWIKTYDGVSLRTDNVTGEIIREDDLESATESSFNPTVGFVWAATPSSRVRAAAYSGFRGAMPSELFVGDVARRRVTQPNPALSPETLVGVEAGYDFTPSSRFSARMTGFWNEIEDLIQRITTGVAGPEGGDVPPCGVIAANLSCTQRQNVGGARVVGLELGATYRPATFWRVTFAATILDSEITDDPENPDLVGNRIERAAHEQFSLGVSYDNPRLFHALLRGRYSGDRYDDAENEEFLEAYGIVDASLSRQLNSRWEIFGGVENVFDKTQIMRYVSAGPSINAPRLYTIGVRFSSGR